MYRQLLEINVKKLSENATIPTQGTKFAAGYDLYAAEDEVVVCGTRKLIKTNISMEITPGYYGRIAPRSGLAYKSGIDVLAGVID
jgi:dUTP pyrophosphatase